DTYPEAGYVSPSTTGKPSPRDVNPGLAMKAVVTRADDAEVNVRRKVGTPGRRVNTESRARVPPAKCQSDASTGVGRSIRFRRISVASSTSPRSGGQSVRNSMSVVPQPEPC